MLVTNGDTNPWLLPPPPPPESVARERFKICYKVRTMIAPLGSGFESCEVLRSASVVLTLSRAKTKLYCSVAILIPKIINRWRTSSWKLYIWNVFINSWTAVECLRYLMSHKRMSSIPSDRQKNVVNTSYTVGESLKYLLNRKRKSKVPLEPQEKVLSISWNVGQFSSLSRKSQEKVLSYFWTTGKCLKSLLNRRRISSISFSAQKKAFSTSLTAGECHHYPFERLLMEPLPIKTEVISVMKNAVSMTALISSCIICREFVECELSQRKSRK